MKKILLILVLTLGVVYFYSCKKVDNYTAPNMTLTGKVVDITTGENIQTRQPNGIQIRLIQEGYPTPFDFWAKDDGSFSNTKLFAAKYKIIAQQGPFVVKDTLAVDLNTNQDITFEVTPYARLSSVNITVSGTTLTATYKVAKGSTNALKTSVLLCSTKVQVHEATTDALISAVIDLSGYTDVQLATTTFTSTITGLISGTTYYARVGVLTNNSLNRYNYSSIVKVVIP